MPAFSSLVDFCSSARYRQRGALLVCGVVFVLIASLLPASSFAESFPREWLPLEADGLHDPRSRGLKLLQQPSEALKPLAPDKAGNMVNWVEALRRGEIQPRERFYPETQLRKLDLDVIIGVKGSMPSVLFSHKVHTEWLDCTNCHTGIFTESAGGSKISMYRILQGEQCGVCHGAIAFPLTECSRCHNIPKPGALKPEIPPGFNPLTHRPMGQK